MSAELAELWRVRDELRTRIDTLCAAVEALRSQQATAARPVLSGAEAAALVGVGAGSAYSRWAATWGVRPSGRDRWPRRAVMAGLTREADSGRRRRRTPERAAAK